jgi:antitoxin (DNA-binding transcriptional repressor) of toxin-antitoxin stability system
MSDTPEQGRESLPVSAADRAEGRAGRTEGRAREPGRPASRAQATARTPARKRIGIRELRQHASVYVDLAEKGYTVDITNRGRLVAQLVPVGELGSPLERLIAAGIIEPAEEPGGVGDIDPYPASPAGSATAGASLGRIRRQEGR